MASSVIHMAVANEVNKVLKRDNSKLLIGSIAPDISKQIGQDRTISHFIFEDGLIDLDKFLDKYKNNLDDDFVLGYYIHLLTDYFWFKYFMPEITNYSIIKTLDGKELSLSKEEICKYIYNDYTNINIRVINEYNMDLKIFFNELPEMKKIIEEIPMDKLQVIIDKAGNIIMNSTNGKNYTFDIKNIKQFISFTKDLIINKCRELGIENNIKM